MVLGILEPRSNGTNQANDVPGTQTLDQRLAVQALKHTPTPSRDPKDPLNWPTPRKHFILAILCAQSIMAASLNPILATNTFQLIFTFDTTFTDIAMLTGYNVLALGLAAPFFSATCRVYGRRSTFVVSSVLMTAGSFWAAGANSYNSLLGARILQGIGIAPFEGLIQQVVSDLYFVSQRGKAFAVVAVAYLGGSMITPIITGKLTEELGRRAPFWIIGGVSLFWTLVIFLFFEETAYTRDPEPEPESAHSKEKGPSESITEASVTMRHDISTFKLAKLSLYSGTYSKESLVKLIVRPVILIAHPAVFWGCASQGLVIAWTVMLATVVAAIFASTPYFFPPSKIGYLYTAPLIGSFIALLTAGLTSDYLTKKLTVKKGVYEPEYRLFLAIPFTIAVTIGLFGFGYSIDMDPVIPAVFFGFVIAGVILAIVAVNTYIADAYPGISIDCYISFLLVKNLLAYALTVKGYDWLNHDGVRRMFLICGCTQLGVCLLSLPMYFFGKIIRDWSSRSSFSLL